MILIEQLGGYENAKECLNTPTARECIKNELRTALIEYRRENNVFEVGDRVVRLDNDNLYIYTVQKVDSDCITIVRKKKSNVVKTWGTWVSYNELRHATDKEIVQGYRDE